ncbi:aldo/keto reductase [Lysinibacillus pakistanensis]|uniref:aldo/keto reductase n=1 Tax=Lysinibacillus pakistanensis TaxID=759811 RepID=UPI003D2BB012
MCFSHALYVRKNELCSLKGIAEEKHTTLPNLALAWLLAQDGVDAVIPGGKHKKQVANNVKATDILLTNEDLVNIERILI